MNKSATGARTVGLRGTPRNRSFQARRNIYNCAHPHNWRSMDNGDPFVERKPCKRYNGEHVLDAVCRTFCRRLPEQAANREWTLPQANYTAAQSC
mmetsp:Transcript_117080/g.185227  ORF Transcript_117080/g.185227 Transcript_117080/m.185227 type:complete len:95 (-) Transcript_117080:334-618(-)